MLCKRFGIDTAGEDAEKCEEHEHEKGGAGRRVEWSDRHKHLRAYWATRA